MPRFFPNAVSVQVNLAGSFNLAAMYTDGTAFGTGGFDGLGNAWSATLLGSGSFMGFPFTVGAPNVVNATIPLPPGQYSALLMVGAAVNGGQAAQSFTVTYSDGSTTVFTQGISDWVVPSSFSGEYVLGVMGYRNTSSGGRDSSNSVNVYGYVFYLNGSKIPTSITLPANNNVAVIALTLVKIGMELELKKQGGFCSVILFDVQTADGTNYFWSDVEGIYPAVLTGAGNQLYSPWVKSAGPFKRTRDLSTDTADLIMQNLSGNSIDRDVAGALKAHEFEGALAIVRLWSPLVADVIDVFYASMSEQNPAEDEVSFRLLQLFDTAQYDVADDIQSEFCSLRYKELACGSSGSAATCLKRFIDCNDASRAASERFNAILSFVPNPIFRVLTDTGGNHLGGVGGGSVEGGGRGIRQY